MREERSGTTGFTLTVGADGTVKDCLVTVSSGFAELDTTTCSLIRERARFTPAKDKKGEAVQGSWSSRVRWEIPQTSPNPRPGSYTIEFVVEADGSLSNCVSSVQGGSAGGTPPITECPAYTFTPYLDATGKAVRKKVKLTNSVEVKDAP